MWQYDILLKLYESEHGETHCIKYNIQRDGSGLKLSKKKLVAINVYLLLTYRNESCTIEISC